MNKTEQGWYKDLMDDEHYKLQSEIYYYRYFKDIPDIDNLKVLDFGSGIGQYTSKLNNVICYELNELALKEGKKRGLNITNNLNNLEDEKFDIVFCSFCLEHCLKPFKELENIFNKLKKGGRLILISSYIKNYLPENYNFHSNSAYYVWNFITLNNLLIKSGFNVLNNKFLGYKGNRYFYNIFNFKTAYFLTWFVGLFFKKTHLFIECIKDVRCVDE